MTEGLWTLEEAADYLKVSLPSLRRLHHRDRLPFVAVSARHKRVDPEQLRDWLHNRTVVETGDPARSTPPHAAGASPSASAATHRAGGSARNGSFGRKSQPAQSSPSSTSGSVVDFRSRSRA